jgi:hypothetical protein
MIDDKNPRLAVSTSVVLGYQGQTGQHLIDARAGNRLTVPVTINAPDSTSVNNRTSRANQYRKMKINGRTLNDWFGSDASAQPYIASNVQNNGLRAYDIPDTEQFGTASPGTERAPGFEDIDLAAGKLLTIFRENAIEFRTETFSIANIASHLNPDNGISDSNFGQIKKTYSVPRTLQLSLHYKF